MSKNKYNLSVGDKIKRSFDTLPITSIKDGRIIFNNSTDVDWSFDEVNENLDSGDWKIVERAKKSFPEKWKIKGSMQFAKFIKYNTILNRTRLAGSIPCAWYFNSDSNNLKICTVDDIVSKHEEVTIEQLKEHYSSPKENEMKNIETRKINHYKVKSPVAYIGYLGTHGVFRTGQSVIPDSPAAEYFLSIGILNNPDIFEVIYEEELKVGDIVRVVKGQYTGSVAKIISGIHNSEAVKTLDIPHNPEKNYYISLGDIIAATEEEKKEYERKNSLPVIGGRTPVREKIDGVDVIAYGCVKLTKETLISYKYFLDSAAKGRMTVQNTIITVDMLDKLIKALD